MGRCALVSATAVLLIQCAFGEDLAIAATYSPTVVGQQTSSFFVDSVDGCNAPPMTTSTISFTKKITRVGSSHAKGTKGLIARQSTVGLRKIVSLVKRLGGSLSQLKNSLLARQVACSSIGALPMASMSAATFGNTFSAVTRLGLAADLSVLRSSFGTSINLLSLCTIRTASHRYTGEIEPSGIQAVHSMLSDVKGGNHSFKFVYIKSCSVPFDGSCPSTH